jgi:hypothetical protein
MSADMAQFTSDMGKVTKIVGDSSKQMVGSLDAAAGAINKIGQALVGIAAGAGFAKLIDGAANWNIQAKQLSNTFGITTEAASVFEVAIKELGIEHDTAVNAALKLSRTLAQGTDKFDEYGISVKDASGHLLPMPQIMANVNEKLLETKSGADRNVIAMALYGRSWGQLQEILRLTPEAMQKAQDTAERLHLIVGPEGVAKAYEYKESIHDLELVSKSLAVQFGNELMPAVISVASAMNDQGVNAAGGFGHAIKELVRDIQEATVFWTSFADRITAWASTGGLTSDLIDDTKVAEEYKNRMAIIAQAEAESLEAIAKAYDRKTKTSAAPTGDLTAVPNKGGSKELAAANAYLAYLKTYYETIAQLQKQANDASEQVNQISYNWGLTALQSYLDKKHSLNENSLQIELDAKQKELKAAQDTEKKALALYNANPTDEMAAKVNKSYETTQKAIMAVNAVEAKWHEKQIADADETKTKLYDQSRDLNNLQIQILELVGSYEKVAKARVAFTQASPEYQRLSLSPEGLAQKQLKDILDNFSIFQSKQREQSITAGWQFGNRAIANRIPDIFGNMAGPQADLALKHDQDMAMINAQIATYEKMKELYGKDLADYQLVLEKKKLLDQQYSAESQRLEMEKWTSIGGIVAGQLGQIAGMMNKNDKTQFEMWKALAIGQAIISTALAVAGILGAASKLGVAAIPLAYMAGAIGMAQVGIIAGTQYQGREFGGAVSAGQSYWVGEKGAPELFTPGASGMITPADKVGGANVTQHITIDARGADPEVVQRINVAMAQAKEQAKAEIFSSMQRGGVFAYASGRMK